MPAGVATLHFGVVEKMDTSCVNGHWVGASSWVENPRAYRLAADVLHPGRNQIAVRVFKLKSKLGFLRVPEPVAVRYAWQSNPQATLFNGAGLPAAPFRSDDWPGVTENRAPW